MKKSKKLAKKLAKKFAAPVFVVGLAAPLMFGGVAEAYDSLYVSVSQANAGGVNYGHDYIFLYADSANELTSSIPKDMTYLYIGKEGNLGLVKSTVGNVCNGAKLTVYTDAKLVLTGGTLTQSIDNKGTVVLDGATLGKKCVDSGILRFAKNITLTDASCICNTTENYNVTNIINDGVTLKLGDGTKSDVTTLGGTLNGDDKDTSGVDGKVEIVGNVSAQAGYFASTLGGVTVNENKTLTLTGTSQSVLGAVVSGYSNSNLTISGKAKTDAANINGFSGTITVESNGSLSLSDGTLTKAISNSGTVSLSGATLGKTTTGDCCVTGGTLKFYSNTTVADASCISTATNTIDLGVTLTLQGGTLGGTLSGSGSMKIGTADVAAYVSASADMIGVATKVVKSDSVLTLTGGSSDTSVVLRKAVTGDGSMKIGTGDVAAYVSASANNIGVATEVVKSDSVLTLTGTSKTLSQAVSGSGKVVIDGTVSANASLFTQTGGLDVKDSADTLTLTEGTLSQDITNNGTVVIAGDVEIQSTVNGTVNVNSGLLKYTNANKSKLGNTLTIASGAGLDPAPETLAENTTNNGSLWLADDGMLSVSILGTGTTYLKSAPGETAGTKVKVNSNVTIAGTLNGSENVTDVTGGTAVANTTAGTIDMTGDSACTTLTIGTLAGTTNLMIDVDMSNFTSDKLSVTNIDGATVNLSGINITKDIVTTSGGTLELPKTEEDKITYVTATSGTASYKINDAAEGSIEKESVVTNNYKYTFTTGTKGTLTYKVEAVNLTFKNFVEGTLGDGSSDPATLSLTEDLANNSGGGITITMGSDQSNDAITLNLNNNKMTGSNTNTTTVNINSGKTMNINGGDTSGTLDESYTYDVAGGGALNFSGNTKVEGIIKGGGDVTNTGTLTAKANNVQITNKSFVNNGTLTLEGGSSGSVILCSSISGTGNLHISKLVTNSNDKDITQNALIIDAGGQLKTGLSELHLGEAIQNNGTEGLYITSGGTLDYGIKGSGTTVLNNGDVTMNAALEQDATINSESVKLSISADNLQGAVANRGTIRLSGGTLTEDITMVSGYDQGATYIDGDVVITDENVGIKQHYLCINEGKTLTVANVNNLLTSGGTYGTQGFDNEGTLVIKGGTLTTDQHLNSSEIVRLEENGDVDNNKAVTGGTLVFARNITKKAADLNKDNFGGTNLEVAEGYTLTLTGGTTTATTATLGKNISGEGKLEFSANQYFSSDAWYIGAAENVVDSGAYLQLTDDSLSKPLEIKEKATVEVDSENDYDVTFNSIIVNNGTLKLSNSVNIGDKAVISGGGKIEGTLNVGATDEYGQETNEATFDASVYSKNGNLKVVVGDGKTLILNTGTLSRVMSNVDDGGTVRLAGATLDGNGEYVATGTLQFSVKDGEETGTYSVNGNDIKNASKIVDAGVTLNVTGGTVLGEKIENNGTMNFTDVASIGTEEVVTDITNDGTMTVDRAGKVVVYANINMTDKTNPGTWEIKSGSAVEFNGGTIANTVIIDKGASLDPKADVFADCSVENHGTLVLEGGNLSVPVTNSGEGNKLQITDSVTLTTGGSISFDENSTLELVLGEEGGSKPTFFAATEGEIKAENAAISGVTTTNLTGISDAKIALNGYAENGSYYILLGGEAATAQGLTTDNFTYTDDEITCLALATDKNGVLAVQTIKTTKAEENVNCFAGIQQGLISVNNQATDAVADHLGLLNMVRVEKGKYSKDIWATYIRNKDNSDGMSTFSSAADGKNAGGFGSNYTAQVNGVTVGADLFTTEKAVGGIAINYATGTTTGYEADATLNNKTKYYGVEFYNRITNKHHAVLMDIGYMRGNNEISAIDKKNWTADADVNSITAGVRYERDFQLKGGSRLVPFAGVRYIRLQNKDFSNSKSLDYNTGNQNLYQPKLGVAWAGEYKMSKSDWVAKPRAEVGYLWALGDREAETTSRIKSYTAVSKYDVTDKSSYYGKLGIEFKKSNFAAGVDYTYMKGSAIRNNKWNINVSWAF